MAGTLTIGQLAHEAETNPDTIRYYERLRLLPPAKRTAAGYRIFPPEAAKRIALIRRAKAFGFSLKEIAVFMHTRDAGGRPCHDVRAAAERKLAAIEAEIRALSATRRIMRRTLSEWDGVLAATPEGELAHLLERAPDPRASIKARPEPRTGSADSRASIRRSRTRQRPGSAL